jgi:putative restriction endonuclease
MKAVFDTRADTVYDDEIMRRYHFPDSYLNVARQAVGDWIIYREPRRGNGRQGYVAAARLVDIVPDSKKPKHSYALVENYLPFDEVVPLKRSTGFYEELLVRVENPSFIGRALQGKSVRQISDLEFGVIVRAGFRDMLEPENAIRLGLDSREIDLETLEFVTAPEVAQERRIVQMLVNKKLRAAAFRKSVIDAYDNRCAVTGLRIINGGGKAEVQAAHIWSVANGGPDVVQNGIALSSTAHWLFDRHLISLTDDLGLLVSHNKVPLELRSHFTRQLGRVHLPVKQSLWPNQQYVAQHRELFAGA